MSFFNLASERMNWLSARQKVIAENVANADTPGYRARDVASFKDMLEQNRPASAVEVTNAAHLRGSDGASGAEAQGVRVEEDKAAWQSSLDGNSVVLEQQTIKAGEVSASYKLAANLYRKGYELLTLSVTGNR